MTSTSLYAGLDSGSPKARRGVLARLELTPALAAGLLLLAAIGAAVTAAPILTAADPNAVNLLAVRKPPSADHIFGTDAIGRDLLARVLFGGRVSLMVAGAGMIGSLFLGTVLGMMRAFGPQLLRAAVDRMIDIQLAFPYVLLAIAITSAVKPSVPVLILLMVLAGWAGVARVVRAIALQERSKDYVKAAEVIGASRLRIACFHVFPSVLPSLMVLAAMQTAAMIVFEATLSFLGMGIQPPTASWGGIMLEGKDYITTSWWLTTLPGLAIMLTSLSLVLIGDGLESRTEKLRAKESDA
ncbi:peptide/nickel transport system permease protein [Mycoplana sp. BE70]|uniref:ABC transporter permease n=1 Tax=Mycoplana sp. BE70 TaxID=2817775 RepID=UPI002856C858|nr:ABC transporter permease [Mycoplana sp. BE70]MDR6757112.1 peptide/nickel transport system permease protein [Mycoplana sp. BE70]